MEIALILCAESVSVDQTTNNLSIANVIEGLTAPAFPIALPLTIFALFRRKKSEAEKQTTQLTISLSGSPQPLFDFTFPVDFQGKLATRGIGRIQTLVIPTPGIMSVAVSHKKRVLGTWTVEVSQMSQPMTFTPMLHRSIEIETGMKAKTKKKKRKGLK